jgi:TDG/mug DNA glycosylase family protein
VTGRHRLNDHDPNGSPRRPTRAELEAARGAGVPDLIGPGLSVLFCGINPSLYSAVVGHHFARPGNRFWPALHLGGFTPRRFDAWEGPALLALGYGVTNVVARATAAADELRPAELAQGGRTLAAKVRRYRPRFVAVLGVTAYRAAFGRPRAGLGRQPEPLAGAAVWVLPNPSGLNAHYQAADLGRLFAAFRAALC